MREDRFDTGKSERFRNVDSTDPRVRMRAPEYARVEHSREANIVCVGRLARDALDGIDARCCMTDCLQRRDRGVLLLSHREPPFAAASTAST